MARADTEGRVVRDDIVPWIAWFLRLDRLQNSVDLGDRKARDSNIEIKVCGDKRTKLGR